MVLRLSPRIPDGCNTERAYKMKLKHLTRFTYTDTSFQGWRVAIRRQGYTLTRYFSDRQHENPEAAYEQALKFRDMVLMELEQNPGNELEILTKHRAQPNISYPAGLKPNTTQTKEEDTNEQAPENCACSVRSNRVMQGILKKLCNRLQLDTASVLKLSLYLFSLQFGCATAADKGLNYAPPRHKQVLTNNSGADTLHPDLHQLIAELEKWGKPAGLPSFEEFSTGRSNSSAVTAAILAESTDSGSYEPPHNTFPTRSARAAIAYFNHFYNSQRLAASSPILPKGADTISPEHPIPHHSLL